MQTTVTKAVLILLLLCPLFGRTQATTGYHRVGQVFARAPQGGVQANVVPNAKITVTNTATGLAATIYSDPLLTARITPPLVAADASGNYSYYIPLNYCVTETITSPGQSFLPVTNVCANAGSITTPVPISIGGTGAITAPTAESNLLGNPASGYYVLDCTSGTSCVPSSYGGIGPIFVADSYPGSDCGAKINAAIVASSGLGTIQVGIGCGSTISTEVNPSGKPVAIQFVNNGIWWLSAPIIDGATGGSIFGPPASESNPPVTLKAVANYTGKCPADIVGTTYSALICMQDGSTLRDLSIHGNYLNQPTATVTSYAASGGVCTLQAVNTFSAGQPVYFNITTGPKFLNPELPSYTVLSSGLSGSQFEVNCPGHSSSGSVTGTAAAAIQDVLLQNAGHGTISSAAIVFAAEDGLHATSTFYPTVTASEILTLNTIVFLYSSTGLPQLYKVTVAGTGTSSYPGYPASGCTPILGSTCTWGGVTLTNIGATYDNTSSNMFVGPNVLFYQNGRDCLFKERSQDWSIAEKVQFEGCGRDGTHEEDSIVTRYVGDDWGANGRYGHYVAAVNSQCASQDGAGGDFISGAQFAGNTAGDIVVNGSAASAIGFCATPSAYQITGNMVIDGNQFAGPASSSSMVNALQFSDAGGNDMTGNNFGNGHFGTLYNYLVASSFSALTGTARLTSTISNTTVSPNYANQSYQASSPFALIAGVDVADASISQGTKTVWGDIVVNGKLTVTNSSPPSSLEPENYVLQSQTLTSSPTWGVTQQGSGIVPTVTACPSCTDPYGNTGTGVYTVNFNLGGGGITAFSTLFQGLTPPSGATSGTRKVYLKSTSDSPAIILAGEATGCATTSALSTTWTQLSVYCSTSSASDEIVLETEGIISPNTATIEVWNPCATYNNGQCLSPAGVPVATTTSPIDYTQYTNVDLGIIFGDPFTQSPSLVDGLQGADTYLLTAGTFTGATGTTICKDANGGATTSGCLTPKTTRSVIFTFGVPGGSALSTGVLGYMRMPYACTGLASWSITVDTGTATIATWKIASGTAIPTVSNSISTSGVSISGGTNVTSTTVTDFTTTTTTANDLMAADLTSVSGAGFVSFELVYTGCTL